MKIWVENVEKWLKKYKNDWKWCENMSIMAILLEITRIEQVSTNDESDK